MSAAASVRVVAALFVIGFGSFSLSVQADEPLRSKKPDAKAHAPAVTELKPVVEKRLPFLFGGFGGGGEEEGNDKPVTGLCGTPDHGQGGKAWEKLGKTINFSFALETPLEDVLRYIKKSTADDKANQAGLSIYVDPIGLQEAEKTLTSPVTIDLEDVPVSLGLKLILRQLGMRYYVDPHGIVMIVSGGEEEQLSESPARILEELAAIRGARMRPPGGGMGASPHRTPRRSRCAKSPRQGAGRRVAGDDQGVDRTDSRPPRPVLRRHRPLANSCPLSEDESRGRGWILRQSAERFPGVETRRMAIVPGEANRVVANALHPFE